MQLAGSGVALETVLERLALRRPVFHSEADFQFALAWEVNTSDPSLDVRLESRPSSGIHLDMEVRSPRGVSALELKYLTRPWTGVFAGELFELKNRALDKRRYDVVKDITRIERFVEARDGSNGAVVVLASDPALWVPPKIGRVRSADDDFRVHQGTVLEGERRWGATAGPGTTRGRESDLHVAGRYTLRWQAYATDPVDIRLLIVAVEASPVRPTGAADSQPRTQLPSSLPLDSTAALMKPEVRLPKSE